MILKLRNGEKKSPRPTGERVRVRSYRAFTLAEILITLGVIGVIAAMTLPSLIKNYQKKVTVERLKSTYSIIYQAVKRSEVDNGPIETWDIPNATWDNDNQYTLGKPFAEKYLLPYLQTSIKDCGLRPNKCLPDKYYNLDKRDISKNYSATINHYYSFALKNGVVIRINLADSFVGIEIYLDANIKPAIRGKNTFILVVCQIGLSGNAGNVDKPGVYFSGHGWTRKQILSGQISGTDNTRGCSSNQGGDSCGELIMLDGWKIEKDYPW